MVEMVRKLSHISTCFWLCAGRTGPSSRPDGYRYMRSKHPKNLGLEGQEIHQSNLGWSLINVEDNLGVMSIGFMLSNSDDVVRGLRKNSLVKQFLDNILGRDLITDVHAF